MTPDLPVPDAPNTRDVRLVAQAVQSAEDAALAYARAIGEARRYMASAIEHLDQAEQARELLNQYASGFAAHTEGGSAPQDESVGAPPAPHQGGSATPSGPAGTPAYDPGTQHAAGVMSTPSPGIAIAGSNPPGEDPATPNRPGPPPPPPGGWGSGASGTP